MNTGRASMGIADAISARQDKSVEKARFLYKSFLVTGHILALRIV